MEFTFDGRAADTPPAQSSLGSERLRKAIERNRAKQRKRAAKGLDSSWSPPSSGSAVRRTVANADTTEFATKMRKGVSRSPAQVSYASGTTTTRTRGAATTSVTKYRAPSKSTRKKVVIKPNIYLVRALWFFCACLIVRLIFSDGGIIDYYDKKEFLARKEARLLRMKEENEGLVAEIHKIKNDTSYQKKIVRHHLGHIAKDEYLILFSDD